MYTVTAGSELKLHSLTISVAVTPWQLLFVLGREGVKARHVRAEGKVRAGGDRQAQPNCKPSTQGQVALC